MRAPQRNAFEHFKKQVRNKNCRKTINDIIHCGLFLHSETIALVTSPLGFQLYHSNECRAASE